MFVDESEWTNASLHQKTDECACAVRVATKNAHKRCHEPIWHPQLVTRAGTQGNGKEGAWAVPWGLQGVRKACKEPYAWA